jgi:hypothetical protein
MTNRFFPQAINMERRRSTKAALYNHPVPGPNAIMTRRAKYIVTFLSTLQDLLRYRKWKGIDQLTIRFSGVEVRIDAEMSTRNRPFHERSSRTTVRKKGAFIERIVSGLIPHPVTIAAYGT